MKKITFTLLLIVAALLNNAQNLTVGNPQEDWWYYNQGTIEAAEISIHPQGLYLEIGMYLTFSGRDGNYSSDDLIELVCNFDLPKGSIIHDSWLWFNEDTLKADLIDRWTATSIYNAIVGRRQDPSILYKTWDNNYELRIYPMKGDSTRCVKLAYLVPLTFTSTTVFANLPMNIVKMSSQNVENVKIRIETDHTWKNPRIMEYPELKFVDDENDDFNTNQLLTFNSGNFNYPFTLEMDSPMKNGVFINQLDDEENYYQLAFLPAYFIDDITPKNVLFCVDYSSSDSYVSADEVLVNLRKSIENGLSPIDSFNLMFSSFNSEPISNTWLSVNDAGNIFDAILENLIKNYSNLPNLLFKAVEFVKSTKSGGEIVVLANTEGNGEPEIANDLIKDILTEMGDTKIPIHCANFLRYTNTYYYIGNTYYAGNDYLYINLSRLTGGNNSKILYGQQSFTQFLFSFTQTMGGLISSFDLHTSLDNGFCYSRFDLNSDGGFVYINKPFLQVGKYYGDLPFKIEVAGLYNGNPFSESISIGIDEIMETDTLLEEIWAGNYIELLEDTRYSESNEIVREIIDYSISERVLSIYTAFLAIEPGVLDTLDIDVDVVDDNGWEDGDGDWVTEIEEELVTDTESITIKAYPNPFNSETQFEITLPEAFAENQLEVNIYDISGKVIFSDNIQNISNSALINYSWTGNDTNGSLVPKGTYMVVFSSKTFKQVVKVLKL